MVLSSRFLGTFNAPFLIFLRFYSIIITQSFDVLAKSHHFWIDIYVVLIALNLFASTFSTVQSLLEFVSLSVCFDATRADSTCIVCRACFILLIVIQNEIVVMISRWLQNLPRLEHLVFGVVSSSG